MGCAQLALSIGRSCLEPHSYACLNAYLSHRHLVYAGIECGFPGAQNFGAPNILATDESAFPQRKSHFLQLGAQTIPEFTKVVNRRLPTRRHSLAFLGLPARL